MNAFATNEPIRVPAGVKYLAVALFLVQTATIWYLVGTFLVPMLVTAIAATVLFTDFRQDVQSGQRTLLFVLLGAFLVFKSRVAPVPIPGVMSAPMTQFSYVAGQFMLAAQLFVIVTSRKPRVLSSSLPWFASVTMVCAADIYLQTDNQRTMFQVFVLLFVLVACAFCAMNRETVGSDQSSPQRTRLLAILMLLVGVTGWIAASSLYEHARDLEDLISNFMDPRLEQQQAGFTSKGELRSVNRLRDSNGDTVAMRVYSDDAPGYLRGFAFGKYRQRKWVTIKDLDRVVNRAARRDVPAGPGENAFYLRNGSADELSSQMQVWPVVDMEATVFLPDRYCCVVGEATQLVVVGEGNVSAPDLPIGLPYTIHQFGEHPTDQLTDTEIEKFFYTETKYVPTQAENLAAEIVSDQMSFDENVQAVISYFRDNFEYSTNFEAPSAEDPINWFLTENRAAHCEFFATSAALILRKAGIPTRYCTGFVAVEPNGYGEHWVIRNKYSHAWAEAWDKERGRWVIVEATPSAGIPQNPNLSELTQLWNYIQDRYQVFRVRLYQGGGMWLLRAILSSRLVQILLGLAAIWILMRVRRWRLGRSSNSRRGPVDPHARDFNQLLARVDKILMRRYGLARSSNEPLLRYADRISSSAPPAISDWYRTYSAARYGPFSPDALHDLRNSARDL